MRRILFLLIFSSAFYYSHAQRAFGGHAHYYHNTGFHQRVMTEGNGFSAYGNPSGVSGGPTVELGCGLPFFNINDQFFLMADGCFRCNAIKRTTAGIGGSVSMEMRMYDRPRKYSKWGIDLSYGVNAMAFVWSDNNYRGGFGLLYGDNWCRAGFIRDARSLGEEQNYFLEVQYWNKNLYSCAGLEFDVFSKSGHYVRKKRVKF